jgi:hypothetical protein
MEREKRERDWRDGKCGLIEEKWGGGRWGGWG